MTGKKKSYVTTRRGDQGETSALNGHSYPKSHPVIACVGEVDAARAHLALIRLLVLEKKPGDHERIADSLYWLLHTFLLIGSACSDPGNERAERHKTALGQGHLAKLEAEQSWLEAQIELPRAFIVSAANSLAAQVDIACTVVRRLERAIVQLREKEPEFNTDHIAPFVNRLSDYLYILARYLDEGKHLAADYSLVS